MWKVSLVIVPVKDQAKAVDFYCNKLGCELLYDAPMGEGQRWIKLLPPGGGAQIVPFTQENTKPLIGQLLNITFETTNLDALYEDLSAKGVVFVQKPRQEEFGIYGAMIEDIDGNKLYIAQK